MKKPRSHLGASPNFQRQPLASARLTGNVRGRQGQRGVTLLEVMLALGIAATVLVAVYRLQMQSVAMERIARFHTLAPLLAQEVLAELEVQITAIPATDSGDFGDDYPGYTWQLETEDVDGFADTSGRALLRQIDIQIRLHRNEDLFMLRTYRLVNIGS